MNKEELESLKRKSLELKDCRKELELYKIALKMACKDNISPDKNIKHFSHFELDKIRSLRDFYINKAKEVKGYEL